MMKETADDFMRREVEPKTDRDRGQAARPDARDPAQGGRGGPAGPRRARGLRRPGRRQDQSSSLIFEAVSRLGSFAVSYGAHVGIGTMPLVLFGTPEQKQKYLPRLATGELIAAYALTEPGSGSDALAAKTKAVLSADGKSYRLTGTKQFITNAAFADLFTVFAKVDGRRQGRGRQVHRLPGRAQLARPDRGPRGAQAGHPRQQHLPADPRGLRGAGGERAGHRRPGPQDRLQHPEHRALEAGRGRRRRGEILPRARDQIRDRAQAVRQADRRVRSHPQEDRRHRHPDLRGRVDGLPHRRPDRRPGAEDRPQGGPTPPSRRSTPSRSTPSRRRSSRCTAARCCSGPRTRRCRSSAAPATSPITPSSASAATPASTASSRAPTRSTACWSRARCSSGPCRAGWG